MALLQSWTTVSKDRSNSRVMRMAKRLPARFDGRRSNQAEFPQLLTQRGWKGLKATRELVGRAAPRQVARRCLRRQVAPALEGFLGARLDQHQRGVEHQAGAACPVIPAILAAIQARRATLDPPFGTMRVWCRKGGSKVARRAWMAASSATSFGPTLSLIR